MSHRPRPSTKEPKPGWTGWEQVLLGVSHSLLATNGLGYLHRTGLCAALQ